MNVVKLKHGPKLHLGRMLASGERQWFGIMPIIVTVLVVVRRHPTILWSGYVSVDIQEKIRLVSVADFLFGKELYYSHYF